MPQNFANDLDVSILPGGWWLVAGGILIAFSIAGDADSDVSGDGEGVANGGYASLIFSTSFWSFSLAGFGLSGVLLEIINGFQSAVPTAPLALMVGLGLGWIGGLLPSVCGSSPDDKPIPL